MAWNWDAALAAGSSALNGYNQQAAAERAEQAERADRLQQQQWKDQMFQRAQEIALLREQVAQQQKQLDLYSAPSQQGQPRSGPSVPQQGEPAGGPGAYQNPADQDPVALSLYDKHIVERPMRLNTIAGLYPNDPARQAEAVRSDNRQTAFLGGRAHVSDDDINAQLSAVPGQPSGRVRSVPTATIDTSQGDLFSTPPVDGALRGELIRPPYLMPTKGTVKQFDILNPAYPVPVETQGALADLDYRKALANGAAADASARQRMLKQPGVRSQPATREFPTRGNTQNQAISANTVAPARQRESDTQQAAVIKSFDNVLAQRDQTAAKADEARAILASGYDPNARPDSYGRRPPLSTQARAYQQNIIDTASRNWKYFHKQAVEIAARYGIPVNDPMVLRSLESFAGSKRIETPGGTFILKLRK